MSAHATAQDLSLFIDRELSPARSRWLESHLDECDQCQERYLSTRQLVDGLRGLERVAPPSTLGMTVRQHRLSIGHSRLRQRLEKSWKRWPDPMILGYLGVVVALGVMALAVSRANQQSEDASTVIFAPIESEQRLSRSHLESFTVIDEGTWIEPGITVEQEVAASSATADQALQALSRLGERVPAGTKVVVATVGSEVVRIELSQVVSE